MNPSGRGIRIDYSKLTDKEIVNRIITYPYDESGAAYLICERYSPLCISVCLHTFGNMEIVGDLQDELFLLLRGKHGDWQPLRSFQWRCKLGSWLKITAYNLSLDIKKNLIENRGENISLDKKVISGGDTVKPICIPVDGERIMEHRYRMVLLQEAIRKIDNFDQRFVVCRRLKGYSSKEVAVKLLNYWNIKGIVRYNKKNERIIPNSGYIDNLYKRGYEKAMKIFKTLDV